MLANDVWRDVLVKYEKLTSNAAPGIQDSQASSILTKAQWHFILSRIYPLNNNKKQGLEETEARMQGLGALVTPLTISTFTTGSLSNGVYAELPLDFMYCMMEEAVIDQNDCVTSTPAKLEVDVLSHDEYVKGILDPYKRPYFDGHLGLVWRLVYGRTNTAYNSQTNTTTLGYDFMTGQTGKLHQLVTDGTFNIVDYEIVYLRQPRPVIVTYYGGGNMQNPELDEATMPALVDIAVDLLKEALNQPNTQIIPQMQQIE
jgi:hypothetical protein